MKRDAEVLLPHMKLYVNFSCHLMCSGLIGHVDEALKKLNEAPRVASECAAM